MRLTINPVGSKFVGSSIGAIDFTDTDEMDLPSSLQILSKADYEGRPSRMPSR